MPNPLLPLLTGRFSTFHTPAFAFLFFCGLGFLGYPRPNSDDLFFIGAGLHMAQGGDLVNPLLERQNFPSEWYFCQPPGHSYALAGWLKIFGISSGSLIAFQVGAYVLISWSTIGLLRRGKAPKLLELLVPLGVATATLPIGLRAEPLSIALTMAGLVVHAWLWRRDVAIFFGFLSMFLGALVAARVAPLSAAVALASFVQLWRSGIPMGRLALLAGASGLLTVLGFCLMIDFRLAEFLHTFQFHAAGRTGGDKLGMLFAYLRLLNVTQLPLVGLWIVSLPLCFRLGSDDAGLIRIALFVSSVIVGLGFLGCLGQGMVWYMILSLFALTAVHWGHPGSARSMAGLGAIVAVLLIAHSRTVFEIFGEVSGHIHRKTNPGQTPEAMPQPTPEHPVLIDATAARYVYEYRLPKGAIDWAFSAPFPKTLPSDVPLRPEDIYVVGPTSIYWLNTRLQLQLPLPKWTPIKVARWSFPKHPRLIEVINAKDLLK